MRVVLIVGNGLFFDFNAWRGLSATDWSPQSPTRWSNQPQLTDGRVVLDVLPAFGAFLEDARTRSAAITDFQVFDTVLKRAKPIEADGVEAYRRWYEHRFVEVEARHFLVAALSHFHVRQVAPVDARSWQWSEWFRRYSDAISSAASFNYDLLLETALLAAGTSYRRPGLEEAGHVVLYKPHGSIDFVSRGIKVPIAYPLRGIVERNDFPIGAVRDLTAPRLDADIVLPGEATSLGHFQWICTPRKEWKQTAAHATHLVLLGLSYWPVDQPELDDLVAAVPTTAEIHMVNPSPNEEWLKKLRTRFSMVDCWDRPPDL